MKIRWLIVVRDVIIVTVFLGISGFIVGFATQGDYTDISMAVSGAFLSTLGFCLCGCLTIENRWKHLFIVAVGVWLINCSYQIPSLQFDVLAWVLNVAVIFIPMVIGGAFSLMLVKASKEKDEQKQQAVQEEKIEGKT